MGDNINSDDEFTSNPYKKDEKKTLPEVIISQIDFLRKEFSKEMKKGFEEKVFLGGQWGTITHPDQRKVVINGTKSLYDLMIFYFDEDAREKIKEIEDRISQVDTKFQNKFNGFSKNINNKNSGSVYSLERLNKQKSFNDTLIFEKISQEKLNYLAEEYRLIFRELILLYKRRNELSGKRALSYK